MFPLNSEKTYMDGEVIHEEGSSGYAVFVVISGRVEIFKEFRGNIMTVERLKEGDIFGDPFFPDGIKTPFSARSIGKTKVGLIDGGLMGKELGKLSSDARSILTALMTRYQKVIETTCAYSPRREMRVPKSLAVILKVKGNEVKAYAGDISMGGVFIRTHNLLKQGERFSLQLQLPGLAQPVRIKSEVAWTRERTDRAKGMPAGMGVRFIEMPDEDNKIFKPFISTISKIGVDPFEMSEKDDQILKEYIKEGLRLKR